MVLRLRQHNIGYTADGFYRSDDPTNSVKALKESPAEEHLQKCSRGRILTPAVNYYSDKRSASS